MNNFNLFITEKAKIFFEKKISPTQLLHIMMKKSGCSGYSVVFEIIEKNNDDVYVFNKIPVKISAIDAKKMHDTIIDLKQEGLNQKIVFDNPKAIHQCGCGESFAIKDEEKIL